MKKLFLLLALTGCDDGPYMEPDAGCVPVAIEVKGVVKCPRADMYMYQSGKFSNYVQCECIWHRRP